jgi:NAD(P)-dependent dehydrogenase (short-subunit alcohol dehydrogenase family)
VKHHVWHPDALAERTVLVTGGAGHLGAAMVERLLAAGARVWATGRDATRLKALRTLPGAQNRLRTEVCDLRQPEEARELVRKLGEEEERLDGLVNNAHASRAASIETATDADFDAAFGLAVKSPFALVQAALPLLEASARVTGVHASVVNVASMYGVVSPDPSIYGDSGMNNPPFYGAAKGGLLQLTRYLACHLAGRGVRVNAVSPGPFPPTQAQRDLPNFIRALEARVPMGRVGQPGEAADAVVFLLSSASSYINGANLAVDGGWTAW